MFFVLGLTSAAASFLSLGLSATSKAYAVVLIVFLTVFYFLIVIFKLASISKNGLVKNKPASQEKPGKLYYALFAASILISVFALLCTLLSKKYNAGDQMLETVNSFLGTEQLQSGTSSLYKVNPLTGLEYTNGYPSRLNFMFMPVFYAVLARTFSVKPYVLLWYIIPAFYLFAGCTLFVSIGDVLFKDKTKKVMFYFVCVFLLFCTNLGAGALGFDIVYAGYREMTFVSLILVNFTLYSCLKKKWWLALIPIILEPLAVSCKFGIGACFALAVSLFILSKLPFVKRFSEKEVG